MCQISWVGGGLILIVTLVITLFDVSTMDTKFFSFLRFKSSSDSISMIRGNRCYAISRISTCVGRFRGLPDGCVAGGRTRDLK